MPNTPPAWAAMMATQAIPIVFHVGTDPVEIGLVASLNRPGGNLTGATALSNEIVPKRRQIIHDFAPKANPIAFLVNPSNVTNKTRVVQDAARIVGVRLLVMEVTNSGDLEAVFRRLADERVSTFLTAADPLSMSLHAEIVSLEKRYSIPGLNYLS
jgi:putative ABC transport system substrate-binding protein